ncbi:DYH2-like protein [Mya arenaria]|uniref:DYH2-like protein n=1 Tax=Mya arenaria TaxID=6604 RepID=A0ABY7FMQ3_MYAAR|nr:DYH2-like protein [Mya arenaria]
MSEKGSRTGTPKGSLKGSKAGTPRSSKANTPKGSKSNTPLPDQPADPAAGASNGTADPEQVNGTAGEVEPPLVTENGGAAEDTAPQQEAEENQEPEEFKPRVSDMIKSRAAVANANEESDIWTEAHNEIIQKFIDDPAFKLIIAFQDPRLGFVVDQIVPPHPPEQMVYFIKADNVKDGVTFENFFKVVQYGSVKSMHIESIKNDFSAQLHRFLATLTDTRWKMEGKTVLYIPTEGTKIPAEEAAKNKDLVQRLETAMIHWARQIKEVLNTQDAFEMAETSGPLDEIEFWKNRCQDLSGISSQLDKPGVKKIELVLETAKSSYVAPFRKLASQIKEGSRQAESNLKFLLVLKDPCYELADAKPSQIPAMIPKILNLIRMIWLSNEIIRRCCREINLEKIFDGYVQSGMKSLNECIECCESWKEIYNKTAKLHHKFSQMGWVCQAQIHFARREEGEKTDMPHFAGQKGPEIMRGLLEIETTFEKNLANLRHNLI